MLPVMSSAPSGRLRALSAYSLRGLSPGQTNKNKALQTILSGKKNIKKLMWGLFSSTDKYWRLNRLTFWVKYHLICYVFDLLLKELLQLPTKHAVRLFNSNLASILWYILLTDGQTHIHCRSPYMATGDKSADRLVLTVYSVEGVGLFFICGLRSADDLQHGALRLGCLRGKRIIVGVFFCLWT